MTCMMDSVVRGSSEKKWLREFLGTTQHFAPQMNVIPGQEKIKKEHRGIFTRRIRTDSTSSDDGHHVSHEGPDNRVRTSSIGSDRGTSISGIETPNAGSGDIAHSPSGFVKEQTVSTKKIQEAAMEIK